MWNVKWYLHLVQVTVTSFPAPPPRSTSPSQCLLFIPSGLLPLRAMFDNVWSEKFKFLRRLRFHFLCAMQCRLHVWTRVVATSVWSIWYLVWSGHWTWAEHVLADLDWTGMRMLTLASVSNRASNETTADIISDHQSMSINTFVTQDQWINFLSRIK